MSILTIDITIHTQIVLRLKEALNQFAYYIDDRQALYVLPNLTAEEFLEYLSFLLWFSIEFVQ